MVVLHRIDAGFPVSLDLDTRPLARRPGRYWREPGLRLCLVWSGGALVASASSAASKHITSCPNSPPVALVVARLAKDIRGSILFAALPILLLAGAGAGVAAGLLPIGKAADLLHPRSILVAWVLLLVAVCWLAIRIGGLRGGAVLSLGFLLSFDLVFGLTDTRDIYDTHGIAETVAPLEDDGIAFYGQTYHAEFNFAGRLTRHVANPRSAPELAAWRAAHPTGLVIARPDRTAPGWRPRRTFSFRNSPYAIWHVADAPALEPLS